MFSDTSTSDANQLGIVIEEMNFEGYKHITIKELIDKEMKIIKQCDEK